MIKTRHLLAVALAAGLTTGSAFAQVIIQDKYNVPSFSGTGFALDTGVNSGINPPTTRLEGAVASGLRYIKTAGIKADTAHLMTNWNGDIKMRVNRVAESSTLQLSTGAAPFDFGPALNTLLLSPSDKAVYDLRIKISNAAAGTQRCSFAIGSAPTTATTWDFGVQLYRVSTADPTYVFQKRIGALASGSGTAINSSIPSVGTSPDEIAFLIRVTDAGAESGENYNSRVQVSVDEGVTWIYDSSTDSEIANKLRFTTAARYIHWDVAGSAGPVTYDDFSITWISGPTAGDRVWSGAGADSNWSTAANWGGFVPATGDNLIFQGTTRQANVNNLADITVPRVVFNNGGFSLSGNALAISSTISNLSGINAILNNINWATTGAKMWSLAAGSELVLNGNTSVELIGDHGIFGGGTLRQKGPLSIGQSTTANPAWVVNEGTHLIDGGFFFTRGGYRIGSVASTSTGANTVVSNSGSLNITVAGANLRVGDSANPLPARLVIDGGNITMAGGILAIPQFAGATGEVTQVGGTVTGTRVSFSEAGAGYGSYTISGNGILEVFQIRENTSAGNALIYFDNATLRALPGATNAFMSGLNRAEIMAGGLTLDAQSDITIGQNLVGTGPLTKVGSSTVTLTGNNSYANTDTGITTVSSGRLVVGTAAAGRAYRNVQVADGASFGVLTLGQDGFITNNVLALGSGVTLSMDMSTFANPTNAMIKAANLSATGPVFVELKKTGVGLTAGTIPLIDYDMVTGVNNFTSMQPSLPPEVSGHLVNNVEEGRIDLVITGVPGFRWTAAQSDVWDRSTQNWISTANGLPTVYQDGYDVEFPDNAASGNVNLESPLYPSAVIVSNNLLPYVLTGSSIATPIFKKFGPGSLTRVGLDNDVLTGGIELNGGSLLVSAGEFFVQLTDITPGGTLVKQGPGTLFLNSTNNTYDGAVRIEEGTVKIAHNNALGRASGGAVTILPGASLDLNDFVPGAKPIIVSGEGEYGQGAILDSSPAGGVDVNLRDVTLVGNTTFASSGRWDLRIRGSTGPGPGLKGNGHNLTKVGSGHVSIASQRNLNEQSVYWNMNLGDVFIREGTLTFAENLTLGHPERIIAVSDNAILATFDLSVTNPMLRSIFLTNASVQSGGSDFDTNIYAGPVRVTGSATFRVNNSTRLFFNGPVTGNGVVTISGNTPLAMVHLNGNNTYSGPTTVNDCVLAGSGSIQGDLNVYAPGSLAPGDGVGTFTVAGYVAVYGTNVMEVNRDLPQNSDRLVAGGTITVNILKVVLAAIPRPGDVYQLYNKGVSVSEIDLPSLAGMPGNMSWDTSSLAVDGKLKVNGTALPPDIGSVTLTGGTFTLSGSGGVEGATYHVVTSPNVAAPASSWVPVATNVFGPGGTFSFSTNVTDAPEAFFRIKLP
jgi:autotransporter-associated beta strand protein